MLPLARYKDVRVLAAIPDTRVRLWKLAEERVWLVSKVNNAVSSGLVGRPMRPIRAEPAQLESGPIISQTEPKKPFLADFT